MSTCMSPTPPSFFVFTPQSWKETMMIGDEQRTHDSSLLRMRALCPIAQCTSFPYSCLQDQASRLSCGNQVRGNQARGHISTFLYKISLLETGRTFLLFLSLHTHTLSLSHSTCTHSSSSTMTTTADKPRSKEEWIKADDGLEIFTKTWYPVGKPVATVVFVHGLGEHIVRKLSLTTDSTSAWTQKDNHPQPIFMPSYPRIQWVF